MPIINPDTAAETGLTLYKNMIILIHSAGGIIYRFFYDYRRRQGYSPAVKILGKFKNNPGWYYNNF